MSTRTPAKSVLPIVAALGFLVAALSSLLAVSIVFHANTLVLVAGLTVSVLLLVLIGVLVGKLIHT